MRLFFYAALRVTLWKPELTLGKSKNELRY